MDSKWPKYFLKTPKIIEIPSLPGWNAPGPKVPPLPPSSSAQPSLLRGQLPQMPGIYGDPKRCQLRWEIPELNGGLDGKIIGNSGKIWDIHWNPLSIGILIHCHISCPDDFLQVRKPQVTKSVFPQQPQLPSTRSQEGGLPKPPVSFEGRLNELVRFSTPPSFYPSMQCLCLGRIKSSGRPHTLHLHLQ